MENKYQERFGYPIPRTANKVLNPRLHFRDLIFRSNDAPTALNEFFGLDASFAKLRESA